MGNGLMATQASELILNLKVLSKISTSLGGKRQREYRVAHYLSTLSSVILTRHLSDIRSFNIYQGEEIIQGYLEYVKKSMDSAYECLCQKDFSGVVRSISIINA